MTSRSYAFNMAPTTALELAEHVVTDGFVVQNDALTALYRTARQNDVSDVLVTVASDDAAPRAVRERALGRIVVQLARTAA
jgi:hypothetical protein